MSEWISVKDRLPEDDLPEDSKRIDIRVLVCTAGKPSSVKKLTRSSYNYSLNHEVLAREKEWFWCRDARNITHWMPLPEVPKEDSHD